MMTSQRPRRRAQTAYADAPAVAAAEAGREVSSTGMPEALEAVHNM
jgi:hypothetical protein